MKTWFLGLVVGWMQELDNTDKCEQPAECWWSGCWSFVKDGGCTKAVGVKGKSEAMSEILASDVLLWLVSHQYIQLLYSAIWLTIHACTVICQHTHTHTHSCIHTDPPKLKHIHMYVNTPYTATIQHTALTHWHCQTVSIDFAISWNCLDRFWNKKSDWMLKVKHMLHIFLTEGQRERERESDDRAVCMNCVSSEFRLSTHSDREIKKETWYLIMKIRSCPVPLSDWTIWYLFSDASHLIYLLMLWASHSQNWQSWTVEPIC